MELYILRHAPASEEPLKDSAFPDDRPLSDEGRERMAEVARGLRSIGMNPARIVCSPLSRTRETADILARELGTGIAPQIDRALAPGATLKKISHLFDKETTPLALVGHNPDVGMILAELLRCRGGQFHFKKAACAKLEIIEGLSTLSWFLPPMVSRKL